MHAQVSTPRSVSRSRISRRRFVAAGAVASAALATGHPVLAAALPHAPSTAAGNFAGPVDIGGRHLWLEGRGEGNPTVILVSGMTSMGDIWIRDYQQPAGKRTMVLPGVAGFARVYAYDRPGTLGEVNPDLDPYGPLFYPSRSDPVHQPRTTQDCVIELRALLQTAEIPAPYVLVGHSIGGLVVRLYACTYPDEVVGMVLVDATQEDIWRDFKAAMTPALWSQFEAANLDDHELRKVYPEAEQLTSAPLDDCPSTVQVREAQAKSPMRPMPLAVLSHGIPFGAPFPGWPTATMEQIMSDDQDKLARLVPNARHTIARKSGHNIHQDQPDLVIDAIRQVVEAVRNPGTWTA